MSDNGGTGFGPTGKIEDQYQIGNRLVWLDEKTAARLRQKERDGTLDDWWYEDK